MSKLNTSVKITFEIPDKIAPISSQCDGLVGRVRFNVGALEL